MFAAIRRAWRAYLDSIPKPEEPEPLSDKQIVREHFRPAPVPPGLRSTFDALADVVVAHLPAELAYPKAKQLKAKLKPGEHPAAALAMWIHANCGPKSRIGVMELDWKAREEIHWQAERLATAHGVPLTWRYEHELDVEWQGWQERSEVPADTPLKGLARALLPHGLALCRFSVDDSVYAFAVSRARLASVLAFCSALDIKLESEAEVG